MYYSSSFKADARLAQQLPLKILLAEDNAVNQKVILTLLQRMGYQADVASNGLEVLAALRRQRYDVVLMDVQMPQMDGLAATRQICQEWEPSLRPRIVAMTAEAMEGDRQACLEVGMDDYLSKPIPLQDLVQALVRCHPQGIENTPAAIDPEILQEIADPEDAPGILIEIIDLFFEDALRLMQAIREARASGDFATLQQAAHTLKSTSAAMGATVLPKLCQEIETIAQSNGSEVESAQITQIEEEYERVKAALQQERQRYQ